MVLSSCHVLAPNLDGALTRCTAIVIERVVGPGDNLNFRIARGAPVLVIVIVACVGMQLRLCAASLRVLFRRALASRTKKCPLVCQDATGSVISDRLESPLGSAASSDQTGPGFWQAGGGLRGLPGRMGSGDQVWEDNDYVCGWLIPSYSTGWDMTEEGQSAQPNPGSWLLPSHPWCQIPAIRTWAWAVA